MMPTTRAASTPSRSATISASNMDHPPRRRRRRDAVRRRRGGFRAAEAEARDLQRVPHRHEAVRTADLRLQGSDPRADELHHPAAAGAHQMIVLLAGVNVLVEEA